MPATVSSRSRKADTSHHNEPAAKKQRLESPRAQSKPTKTLASALLTNGSSKKLEAKSSKISSSRSAHAVSDAKSIIGTTIGQTSVPPQDAVIEISSDSDSEDEDDEDEKEDEAENDEEDEQDGGDGVEDNLGVSTEQDESRATDDQVSANGLVDSDKENRMDEEEDDEEQPTFGELLSTAPIDVQSALMQSNDETNLSSALQISSRQTGLSSTTSLATVLSQALKTNDRTLLETCFMTNDLASVRSTIQRLPSAQVEALLHHIADKMHKRPGRASNLMVWIQWSLVSHGGYLARRKDIVSKLGALNRVIKERANGLQPLLVLKGKLDMLAAQLELRREMMQAHQKEMDDDDDVVIYVEGQEEVNESRKDANAENDEEDDDEEDDEADFDIDSRMKLENLDASDSDDDDDETDESSEEEEVSGDGFSDQEVEQEESASDIEDDSDDDEAEEITQPIVPSSKSTKRKSLT